LFEFGGEVLLCGLGVEVECVFDCGVGVLYEVVVGVVEDFFFG